MKYMNVKKCLISKNITASSGILYIDLKSYLEVARTWLSSHPPVTEQSHTSFRSTRRFLLDMIKKLTHHFNIVHIITP